MMLARTGGLLVRPQLLARQMCSAGALKLPIEAPVKESVKSPLSLATANSKEVLQYKITQRISQFQSRPGDPGNSAVQVAIFTERINNLARHMVQHKKDHATKRGLQMLVAKRQKLLAYMKNHDFESFKRVVQELGLQAEAKRILD